MSTQKRDRLKLTIIWIDIVSGFFWSVIGLFLLGASLLGHKTNEPHIAEITFLSTIMAIVGILSVVSGAYVLIQQRSTKTLSKHSKNVIETIGLVAGMFQLCLWLYFLQDILSMML